MPPPTMIQIDYELVWRLVKVLGGTFAAFGLSKVLRLIYGELTSPLRDLPGPESSSWLYGNFKEIWKEEISVAQEKWVQKHGTTLKFKGFFGITRLFTMDPKALNHVLMNPEIYQKPSFAQYSLSRIVGEGGVLVVEGEKHKHQRKVMNPAFGPTQVRELTEIFLAKSVQLRDIWASTIDKNDEVTRIEVLSWMSKATLDIIGLAGFNYNFDALNDVHQQNELNVAFSTIFHASSKRSLLHIIKAYIPTLRFLRGDKDAEIRAAKATMARIGNQLLRESKLSAQDKTTKKSRDLLSLLVHSNMSTDVPAHQRMSDEDVLAQVPTFLVAGHETTSTSMTWALFALSQDLRVQTKLRDELLAVETDSPTMDELNTIRYLDIVVREVLRLYAPVPSSVREATKDDILPLSQPLTNQKGVVLEGIRVRKGQTIQVPVLAMNRSKEIWGDDAREFRPERWESMPEAAARIPGVWGNMLTFLGGPRSCIGHRFSVVELKALLFVLVRAFEFELAVPVSDIGHKATIVQRPVLLSEPEGGYQLPMIIRHYTREV